MRAGVIKGDFKEDTGFELVLKLLLAFGLAKVRGRILQMGGTP